ncbi:hypothetical protein HDU98_009896, partial [Podochytrium sp. JEL0797]
MFFFVGLPFLLIWKNSPTDRKSFLPVAIPMAMFHLYSMLILFSTFLTEVRPTLGPAKEILPVLIGELLNQMAETYRIRLWIANAVSHLVFYVWFLIWIVRVQETGGIPGFKLSAEKSKKE